MKINLDKRNKEMVYANDTGILSTNKVNQGKFIYTVWQSAITKLIFGTKTSRQNSKILRSLTKLVSLLGNHL